MADKREEKDRWSRDRSVRTTKMRDVDGDIEYWDEDSSAVRRQYPVPEEMCFDNFDLDYAIHSAMYQLELLTDGW